MSNFNFNKVFLAGRLTQEPELKTTSSGINVTTFGLAVQRKAAAKGQQPVTDFLSVTAWRNAAELICKYFRKGDPIFVEGNLQVRAWKDSTGKNRYQTDVVVESVSFIDSKGEKAMPEPAEAMEDLSSDQDLPF